MARKSSTLGTKDVAGLATVLSYEGFRNHMAGRDAYTCNACAGARLVVVSRNGRRLLPISGSIGMKTGSTRKLGP